MKNSPRVVPISATVLLFVPVIFLVLSNSSNAQTQVFKSGFEEGTYLEDYQSSHERFGGTEDGWKWDDFRSRFSDMHMFYLVGNNDPDPYVGTFLTTDRKRSGNKSLLLQVKGDFDDGEKITRSELSIFPKEGGTFAKQGYVSYYMYLSGIGGDWPSRWINFIELKESRRDDNENYRITFYVRQDRQGKRYWNLQTQDMYNGDTTEVNISNKKIPVPVGQWIKVEMFWRQGDSENGRLLLKIDGKPAITYSGRTQHKTNPMPIRFWSPIKSYRAKEWSAGSKYFNVWYDDVEFWTAVPASK